MDKELAKKIEWVKETLRGQEGQEVEVQDLALFDVKEGQDGEDGAPHYYETYLNQTTASMGALFKKTEWGKLTPWEKLCCYKISGRAGVDCDAALRSTVIYQLAFELGEPMPYDKKGHYRLKGDLKGDGFILRGDTMNSYATTVHEYIHSALGSNFFDDMKGKNIVTGKSKKGRLYAAGQYCRSGSDNAHWERAILHQYDYFKTNLLEKLENSEKFFELYHTVGNFIPWPDGCNVPRGSGPVEDYWDLTLYRIYQWYQANKDLAMPKNDALLKLFGSQMVVFPNWLASFGSWDNFVRRNYMQDFVYGEDDKMDGKDVPDDGHFGPPKELWKGHFNGSVKPKEKTDFEQFFTNASAWITARGLRIALAVKEALAAEGQGAAAGEARS